MFPRAAPLLATSSSVDDLNAEDQFRTFRDVRMSATFQILNSSLMRRLLCMSHLLGCSLSLPGSFPLLGSLLFRSQPLLLLLVDGDTTIKMRGSGRGPLEAMRRASPSPVSASLPGPASSAPAPSSPFPWPPAPPPSSGPALSLAPDAP